MKLQFTTLPKSIVETRKLSADRALAGRLVTLRKPPAREVAAWAARQLPAERRSA